MTIGDVIQNRRKQAGLSQEKLAELVGTSRQAVAKWEAGKSIPCMENMISLAEIFGISLIELSAGGTEEVKAKNSDAPKKKNGKSPITLLHNLSLIGYIAIAVAGAGCHQYLMFNRGLPIAVWLIIALLGGICLSIRSTKYRSLYGKLPSLIPDFVFIAIVSFVPRIPVPNGFSILLMQILAVLYIILYLYKLCPWRSPWRKEKKVV